MRKLLFSIILIIGTISCSSKIDYQKTINAIESNQNLFNNNYSLHGKANLFFDDSVQYFYFENDTIEYVKVFKSKFLDDYKNIIKNYEHFPAKVSFYKYKNFYSIKVQYIEDSKKKTDFYKNIQIVGFYFNKKLETKTYRLSNYNKLFYTKSLENKNSYEFQNEYKISQKLKDNWYLLERIE